MAYLTLMDKLMIAAFILIALSALENMIAVPMSDKNPDGARRLDRLSRRLFPIAYVTLIGTVAVLAS